MGQLIGFFIIGIVMNGISFLVTISLVSMAGGEGAVQENVGSCIIASTILLLAFSFAYMYSERTDILQSQNKKD